MRISDWSSDVCSSDLCPDGRWRRQLSLSSEADARWRRSACEADEGDGANPTFVHYMFFLGQCQSVRQASRLLRAMRPNPKGRGYRSEEHTSELQSLMRISYAVFCLKKKTNQDSKK